MDKFVQVEVDRINATQSFSDFEWAINVDVKRWQSEMGLTSLDYRTAVQQYWKERL